MDTEKIIRLGHELQAELGFHPDDRICCIKNILIIFFR